MSDADMLHHTHRDNPVKLSGKLAIVQLAKYDAIGNAGGFGINAALICSGETLTAVTCAPVSRAR